VENYQPLSNMSVLTKTLECAMTQQLESYLGVAGLLPWHQSAYRKGHSTERAFLKVSSDLTAYDGFWSSCTFSSLGLIISFWHGWSSVPVDGLSQSFGVSGDVLSWTGSYLSCRCYTVQFGPLSLWATECCTKSFKDQCSVHSCLFYILLILVV